LAALVALAAGEALLTVFAGAGFFLLTPAA
jgi:hypothetical protein